MPATFIQNKEGLYATTEFRLLITETALNWLKKELPSIQSGHPKLAEAARELIKQCEALPICPWAGWLRKNDHPDAEPFDPDNPTWMSAPARGWLSIRGFSSTKPDNAPEMLGETFEALGWDAVAALRPHAKQLDRLAELLEINAPNFTKATLLLNNREGCRFTQIDEVSEIGGADSFAIYLDSGAGHQGYLGADRNFEPLVRARLFESVAAAQRTLKATGRSQSGVAIVRVQTRAVAIDPSTPEGGGMPVLAQAVALEEARQLQEALKEASVDALRARLAELEAANPSAAAASARPKRRL